MFENIKECLNEFEEVLHKGDSGHRLNEQEEDVIINFSLNLAKALIQDKYVDSEKVAKIILAAAGLSNEVIVKIE